MEKQLEITQIESASCIASAWLPFAETLAQVLEGLQEDQYLIITAKRSNLYVQFAGQGAHGLRMETTSNHYLEKSEQLTQQQIDLLKSNGWQSPTKDPRSSSPEDDPEGSPNFFIDYPLPVAFKSVAALVVKTFDAILRITHPGYLEYEAFDSDDNSLAYPSLGLKRRTPSADHDPEQIRQRLLATVQEFTGLNDLAYDQDGDIVLQFGTAVIFVRYQVDPPLVRLNSPLVTGVEASPRLYARLNELNNRGGYLHFFHKQEWIIAVTDVVAAPFVAKHVIWALKMFSDIVDDMDDILAFEFGGQTASKEKMVSVLTH